MKKIYNLE